MRRKHKVNVWEQRNALQQMEHVAHCVTCGLKEKSLDKNLVELWRDLPTDPELRHRLRHKIRKF